MRAASSVSLVHVVELSAARQALERAPVAPGTHATLRVLTDPERRRPLPREPLNPKVTHTQPAVAFQLGNPGEELRQAHQGCTRTTSFHCWTGQGTRISWYKWRVPWPRVMSLRMFWRSSGLVGSQNYGSQTGARSFASTNKSPANNHQNKSKRPSLTVPPAPLPNMPLSPC